MIDSPGLEQERVDLTGAGSDLAAALEAGAAGIGTLDLSRPPAGTWSTWRSRRRRSRPGRSPCRRRRPRRWSSSSRPPTRRSASATAKSPTSRRWKRQSLSLSLALGVSLRAADKKLALALGLDAHPALADALAQGRIDEAQAGVIYDHAAALPRPKAARLVQSVVADPAAGPAGADVLVKELRDGGASVWSIPAHQLRPILTAAVADLAPETLQPAAEVVRRDRHVAHYARTIDRTAALVLHGPDELLAATYAHLDHQARTARNGGAPETLDQLRFDLAVGHLTAGAFGLTLVPKTGATSPARDTHAKKRRRRLRSRAGATLINVTVADRTLLGLDNHPAVLHTPTGDVPIPAELARALAHDPEQATWRRILCDPATGTATEVSTGYRPATRIARALPRPGRPHLPLPDQRRPHPRTRPHPRVQPHRPRHRRADHPRQPGRRRQTRPPSQNRPLLHVTGDANSELTYTTGTGHTYTSRPHQYLEPQTPPPATEKPPDNGDPPY